MPAPTTTLEADLLTALAELAAHNQLITEANEKMDFAASRALDEQQIGHLEAVAEAADALLEGQILLEIRVENVYAIGATFVHQLTVTAPAPADGEDVDEWAQEHLLRFTGEGPEYANTEALYEVEVTVCESNPVLVGAAASAQG
ncbi:MAG: hypothetical protein WBA05_02420 [Gordonia sp. (in: high G+C Gram-positive bacteria)]|uniref:hypothetical protein n=1 Tax=Gordonia sp. (in: high G+C Gram-positive bacteria) TaxID=84139 RepID=UPI003C74CE5C